MKIDPKTHLLRGVPCIATDNCDERPPGTALDLIIVHCISVPAGHYGGAGIEKLFTNAFSPQDDAALYEEFKDLRVSAHLLVRRTGEIIQFVPFDKRAWHAGVSSYGGRECCNDFSVGIELEGGVDDPFEAVQYERLREVARALINAYPGLAAERIVGHEHVAPARKRDPGPYFDWDLLRTGL